MKLVIRVFSLVWLVTLSACSSQPTVVSPEAKYHALAQTGDFSVYEMRKVVDDAFKQNDLELMSKAQWKLCQRAVASASNSDDCARYLDITIVQGDKTGQARAYLALYFLTASRTYYTQAMALLPSNSDFDDLFVADVTPCLDATEDSETLAMRCYLAGKYTMNLAALNKALAMFDKYGARHNSADTYFLIARILYEQGEPDRASQYAAKAALLLSQLGESRKAAIVRAWRQDNIYAQ